MQVPTFHYRHYGFTLIELVVAITVSIVVVGFVAIFITTPVEEWLAQSRRAELIIEADLIQRNIDNDVRNAVPNSIRYNTVGSVTTLELLHVVDVATYRAQGSTIPSTPSEELAMGTSTPQFWLLGHFNNTALPFPSITDYLVVGHTGNLGQDAYTLTNVITPISDNINIKTNIANPSEDLVTLSPSMTFTNASPADHVFLVSGPVAYVCDTAAHTLQRYEGYGISSAIAANHNSASITSLISQDINTCNNVNVSLSTASRPDLLSMNIQLVRSGEVMPLFIQSSVDNMP